MFKEAGVIEKYGSGIKRIKQACVKYGLKKTVFEEFSNGFSVVLFKEQFVEGVNVGVNDIYKFIKENKSVNARQISNKYTQISQRTIERWLKQLKEENKIEYRGSSKTGGYFIKE